MNTNSKRVALVIGSGSVKIPCVIAEGERAAEEQMPYLKRLLETKQDPVT
jgi:hypothetical protein